MLIKSSGEIPYIRLKDAVTTINYCNFLDCTTELKKDGLFWPYLKITVNNTNTKHTLEVICIDSIECVNLLELTKIIQDVNYSKGYKQGLSTVQL